MTDVEITPKHLKFQKIGQEKTITVKNNRKVVLNFAFRLFKNYEIAPTALQLLPGEATVVTVKLKNVEAQEDFIYIKGDNLDCRIAVTFECDSDRLDQYIDQDIQNRTITSPGFGNLETFGNVRSEQFNAEENKILQQRVNYLTQQNQLLNDALEQFMNQEMDGNSIKELLNHLIEQERQDNEFRSQRVLLMIEEKDREIENLRLQLQKQQFNSNTKDQLKELVKENEKLQMKIQDYQAREQYFNQHQPERESYVMLYRKYESVVDQNKKLDLINRQMNEEIEVIAKRLNDSGLQNSNIRVEETRDELVNRLNARITQLKLREEKLLEENAHLEEMLIQQQGSSQNYSSNQSKNLTDDLLKKEYQILEKSKKELEKRCNDSISKSQILEKQVDEQTKQAGYLGDELWKSQRENEKLKQEIKKLKEQDELIKKERLEYESQIYALEQTLKQASSLQDVKEEARKRWEKEIGKLQSSYENEIVAYQDDAQKLKKIINDLKKENELTNTQLKETQFKLDQKIQQLSQQEEQMQELQFKNQKLQKVNQQNQIDIEKTKSEFIILKEKTDVEFQRRDNLEKQLQDRQLCLQDQINNIMKEKSITQSELQLEMNKLCQQHKASIDQLLMDNKSLEQQYLLAQDQLKVQRDQYAQREEALIREVRSMQDKIEKLVQNQKQKDKQRKNSRSNNSSVDKTVAPTLNNIEEERKISDLYMQKIRELESELNKTRQQKMQIEFDFNQLKAKSTYLQQGQTKDFFAQQQPVLADDLNELKKTMIEMRLERDKIINQLQEKDYQIDNLSSQIQDYASLVQQQQGNLEQMEIKLSYINDDFKKTLEQKNSELHKLKLELNIREEQNQVYQEQTKLLTNERREINEKCYIQNFEIEQMKTNYQEVETSRKQLIQELRQKIDVLIKDNEENNEIIQKINTEIVNQKEIYEEIIERQNNTMELISEKFNQDMQELQCRQNQYFNQNDAYKKSLNPTKEQQWFKELIQSYHENVVQLAQNMQKQKQNNEKNKQLQQTINQQKQQIKELSDKLNVLQTENQNLTKQVEKHKPKIPSLKKPTATKQIQAEKQKCEEQVPVTLLLQQGKVAEVEVKSNQYKIQLKLAEQKIDQLKQANLIYESELKKINQSNSHFQELLKNRDQTISELQKQYKQENQKIINELNQVQNKFVPEDKVQALNEIISQKDSIINQLKDEIQRKKDVADQFRGDREDQKQVVEKLKKQNEDLQTENEKLKRVNKDNERQNSNFKEFKEKYDQMKVQEKQIQDEVKNLQEKNKQLKQDNTRKDANIKELKDKIDQLSNQKPNDSEKQDLVQQVKKLKEEINRKDQAIKHFRQKFDEKSNEFEIYKNDYASKYAQTVSELEKEMRKNEQGKIGSKKYENQVNMLIFLLKRIYRENYMELNKGNQAKVCIKGENKPKNISKFSESMNILNLGPEDLEEFLEPNISVSTVKKSNNKDLDRFETLFMNPDQLDVNQIFNMINNVITERINCS
ncbi:unnamed protein product [Paramecium octaurelia]|uniref:Uncharacterized protein n=1 Tax=Paramecium octaurelia TaxID=43137 RepID=A0A8S1SR61_PAROT|nr:unnamed protein product [Paramecium octaurelia]